MLDSFERSSNYEAQEQIRCGRHPYRNLTRAFTSKQKRRIDHKFNKHMRKSGWAND